MILTKQIVICVICPNVTNKINNGNEKYFYHSGVYHFCTCSGKQAQKDVPVEVEEEEFAIMAAPVAPSQPLIHSVKATQPANP